MGAVLPATTLLAEDRAFLRAFEHMLTSQSNFFLARLREDPNIVEYARGVVTWRTGRFWSVQELFEHCARHRWNDMIFEAWAYETACRVRRMARDLDVDAREALLVYATAEGVMDVLFGEAMTAIEEARFHLYGE